MSAADRLAQLGLQLPAVPQPAFAYLPFTRSGDLVFTAGQLPNVDGKLVRTGKLGTDVTTEEGVELARIAALNVLAAAAAGAGDLEAVRIVKLTVFVASDPSFSDQPVVANGASELLGDILGDNGVHARSAVGVASLPLDSPVEIEAVVQVVSG